MDLITNLLGQSAKLPIAILISMCSIVVGLLLKKAAFFPNRLIPIVVVALCTVAYGYLGDPGQVSQSQPHPAVVLHLYGMLLGFLSWAGHRWGLKRLEKYLPEGFFPPGEFDTEQFVKPVDSPPEKK